MKNSLYVSFIVLLLISPSDSLSVIAKQNPRNISRKNISQRQAELLAEKLIKRWHETLDVKDLFAESWVMNPLLRKRALQDFQWNYQFVFGLADDVKFEPDVDEELIKQGLFAFLNNLSLSSEIGVAYAPSMEHGFEEPDEIKRAVEELAASSHCTATITKKCIQDYIEGANKVSALRRKLLTREKISSKNYQKNLQEIRRMQQQAFKDEKLIYPNLPSGVVVIRLPRGAFDFVFVEENNEIKLLTIYFDPN